MPCFHLMDAWQARFVDPISGSRPVRFHPPVDKTGLRPYDPIKIPCGQCVGCRLERSRQWAIRCMHEAQMHERNCFITLTFSPEFLATRPNPWSLDVRDFQLFMKRLRNKFGSGIRFYHCGEYGSMCSNCDKSEFNCRCGNFSKMLGRPHYHACIFGFDFADKQIFKVTDVGHRLYVSQDLDDLWTDPLTGMSMGFSTIGDVSFESAAYVARYIMKKINGDMAVDYYFRSIPDANGELAPLKPEYTTMSRRPGIARAWFDKFASDVYPHDYVVINGKKMRPPRYYDRILKTERPYTFDDIKYERELKAEKHLDNQTPERMLARETCTKARLNLLTRSL